MVQSNETVPASDDIVYQFEHSGNAYSINGSFFAVAERDCLMDVVSRFEHIARYTSGAKSIKVVKQGEGWYDVTYTYRKFVFFEHSSTWRRWLHEEDNEVTFQMLSSRNNLKVMPDVLQSNGYYRIQDEQGGFRITFFQECTLGESVLTEVYLSRVKKEAIQFLHVFKRYVHDCCTLQKCG